MTEPDNLWKRKIEAFLFTPPDKALAPSGVEERAKALIAAALNLQGGPVTIPPEVKEADRIAKGLNIPPFVEQTSADVFQKDPCLTHPLSGESYRLEDLQGRLRSLDLTKLQECVIEAVKAIRQEIETSQPGQDPPHKRLFLALWRKLPEVIREKEQEQIKDEGQRLGPLWDLLPADPRIPSHSVWDHAAVASAAAGALPEPALLIFDIASVQEFLATARRTQEAWMGSFLLSFLIWEAMKVIAEEYGPDCVVYPSLREQPLVDLWLYKKGIAARGDAANTNGFLKTYQPALQIASFPERFTVIVPAKRAQDLAENAHKALLERWKAIAWAVKCEVEKTVSLEMGLPLDGDPDWEDAWERQIDDCFKRMGIFWVVCPWGTDPKQVRDIYHKLFPSLEHPAEALIRIVERQPDSLNLGMMYPFLSRMAAQTLTARKLLRDFRQVDEPDWKCSLCGLRQVLRPQYTKLKDKFGEKSDEILLRLFWERQATMSRQKAGLKLQGRIRRGDRLCAVCLTKRLALEAYFEDALGFDHHLFPSTATVAAAPFKAKVIERYRAGELGQLENYVSQVKGFLTEHGIYYESSSVPRLKAMTAELDNQSRSLVEDFLNIDGEWLFEESFHPEKIQREYLQVKEHDLKEKEDLRVKAVQALRVLLEAVKERPSRYYAIIAMDGDKMSLWVAGVQAPKLLWLFHPDVRSEVQGILPTADSISRPLGPTLHLALSTILKNFAVELVRTVVEEEHLGKLIYAGGDDVLAFVPVSDLLPVMRNLRRLFQGEKYPEDSIRIGRKIIQTEKGFARIRANGKEDYRLLAGAFRTPDRLFEEDWQGPTVSLGAVIVHESHPLALAIEQARDALKTHAKEKLGRDAFAIHLLRRAGDPLKVGMKWYVRDGRTRIPVDLLEGVQEVVGFIRDGTLSSRLAYDMKEKQVGLAGDLQDLRRGTDPWWLEAQAKEFARLIGRHLKRGIPESCREEARARLMRLFEAVQEGIKEGVRRPPLEDSFPTGLEDPWEVVTKLLLVACFIAGGGENVAPH